MGLSDKINSKSEGANQKASGKVAQKVEDVKDKANDLKHNIQAAADKLKG